MKTNPLRNFALPAVAALTLATTAAVAGPWGHHGAFARDTQSRIERMTEQLDLSEDQQRDVAAILEQQRAQRDLARQQARAEIDALLTDEQRTARDQAVAERLDRRVERMARRLDLTQEQQTAVRELFEDKRQDPTLGADELHERMQSVLSEEQQAMLAQGPGRGGPKDRGGCERRSN
jgi:Spy/CpxP family protein refolding chaperone